VVRREVLYEREGATVVFNVPRQWDLLSDQPDIDKRDLKLRIITRYRPRSRPTISFMISVVPP
jgi:fatty-acyl-CoA synthase